MAATTAMVIAFLGGCGVAALAIVMRGKVDLARIETEATAAQRRK